MPSVSRDRAVYATANLSGGHITPTVTIATMITGHITLLKGLAYILAQLVGSVFGSLLIVRTLPFVPICIFICFTGAWLLSGMASELARHTTRQHCCKLRLRLRPAPHQSSF
jgi:hypothetical protein